MTRSTYSVHTGPSLPVLTGGRGAGGAEEGADCYQGRLHWAGRGGGEGEGGRGG